jgi:integrase
MTHITPTDVAKYIASKQAEGLKGWTIKSHMTALSSVFTYASRHLGLIAQNPVALLDRVERPSSDDEKPKRIMNADELENLLDAVDSRYRLIFDTAAETGCRLGEALGLAWENVSLENQTIEFTHQLDRKGKRIPLKTKRSRRLLEATPGLIGKLREHKIGTAYSAPHQLVFTTRTGSGHDHRNIGGRALARAVKRTDLGPVEDRDGTVVQPSPTFHALRHAHASALIAQGWDIEEVSARLGHASVGTTQRIYVHAFDAARRSSHRRARLTALYGDESHADASSMPDSDVIKLSMSQTPAHQAARG